MVEQLYRCPECGYITNRPLQQAIGGVINTDDSPSESTYAECCPYCHREGQGHVIMQLYRGHTTTVIEDHLGSMLAHQAALQQRLGTPIGIDGVRVTDENLREWGQKLALALMMESSELMDWLPFKWWSRKSGNKLVEPYEMFNEQHIEEIATELIDIQHFLNIFYLLLGWDAGEVYRRFVGKMEVNHQRQNEGSY